MFNKLKQFKDLRSQAKTLQNALALEAVRTERSGIAVTMNGNMEITELSIPENMGKAKLEKELKECLNEAVKKTQRMMAEKMREMGGFPGIG